MPLSAPNIQLQNRVHRFSGKNYNNNNNNNNINNNLHASAGVPTGTPRRSEGKLPGGTGCRKVSPAASFRAPCRDGSRWVERRVPHEPRPRKTRKNEEGVCGSRHKTKFRRPREEAGQAEQNNTRCAPWVNCTYRLVQVERRKCVPRPKSTPFFRVRL